jgi:hypothetical protein
MIAAVVATTSAAAAVSAGQELPQVRHHQLMTAQNTQVWTAGSFSALALIAAPNDASLCQVVRAVFLLSRDVAFFCW